MSSSIHATNTANNIYVMGEGLIQGINDATLYAEKSYWRNFICKVCIIMVMKVIFLLMVDKN